MYGRFTCRYDGEKAAASLLRTLCSMGPALMLSRRKGDAPRSIDPQKTDHRQSLPRDAIYFVLLYSYYIYSFL